MATPDDRATVEQLWQIFRHHMSTYDRTLPAPDGTYCSERLRRAFSNRSWDAWILTAGEHPIGFCLTRAMNEPVRVVNSFFVVAPARGVGIGTAFLRAVASAKPGTWSVAYQDANTAAARFWPTVAAAVGVDVDLEHRPVPGKPHLPPDTWATFRVAPPDSRPGTRHQSSHPGQELCRIRR
ncbi:MAG: GNAT family N-acetyltransferase [Phycicoccus sp.]